MSENDEDNFSSVQSDTKADKLIQLTNERETIIGTLTRFINFTKNVSEDRLLELETRLAHTQQLFAQFDKVQTGMEHLNPSEVYSSNRESFENSYFKGIAFAKEIISQIKSNINTKQSSTELGNKHELQVSTFNKSFLPPIDLPKFDGDYKKWLFFFKRFSALVDQNSSLSNVEKLYYLQGRLQGAAAEVIQDVELTDENYVVAIKLLTDRYENKRVIIDKHVEDLFNLPEVVNESPANLRKLIDTLKQHLRALKSLGEPTESWDRLIIQLIKLKLDKGTRERWLEVSHSQSNKNPSTLDEFLNFLVCRCEYLESVEKIGSVHKQRNSQNTGNTSKHSRHIFQNSQTTHTLSSIQNRSVHEAKSYSCFFCHQSHPIYNCSDFMKLSLNDKYKEVRKLGLCTNCLRKGHAKAQCSSGNCRCCGAKHNTVLHPTNQSDKQVPYSISSGIQPTNSNSESKSESNIVSITHSNHSALTSISAHSIENDNLVLLSTAIIHVKDTHGNIHHARALLDAGSQSNYITESLSKKLSLEEHPVNISISGVGQNSMGVFKQVFTSIKSMHSDFHLQLPFLVLPKITEKIPNIPFSLNQIILPNDISLADPTLNKPGEIDILVGASIFYDLITNNTLSLGPGKPRLRNTKLGWILTGVIQFPVKQPMQKTLCTLSLNNQLRKFWELEETPTKKFLSEEENFCEKFFKDTTSRNSEGRFVVKFPLNESVNQLGDSKPAALNRLKSIEKRFERDPEYKTLYVNFINEYLELDHMSLVHSTHLEDSPSFYLPHHGVRKDSSTTTKLRVVCDGSAVTDSGISLNHCLAVGPPIQDNLFDIIIRFRIHAFILTADVEKMYRMVVIHPEHRRFQRIFWRETKDKPIEVFEMSRLAYGLASSSYLATRCLHELAIHNKSLYPHACEVILHDFFVDDLITGSDSIDKLSQLKCEITSILESGGFKLRKWSSNDKSILTNSFPEHQTFHEKSELKTLGLVWDPDSDVLKYSTNINSFNHAHTTKRQILSLISRIFDPLGLVGPVIIKAKIFMQTLWQNKSNWDDPVPMQLLDAWKSFLQHIHLINNLEIPRHIVCISPEKIEIHGFCDASESAYGCCIYFRSFSTTRCLTRLLCAKSKVAPLKRITLPRLELCGALLLSRLLKTVQNALYKPIDQVYLYTDSQIVLAWISTQPCYLQTFVANRIVEITDLTLASHWHYVPSVDNPADIISRGTTPEQLYSSTIWWNGPSFLQNRTCNPAPYNADISQLHIPDLKISSTLLVSQTITDFSIFHLFSSFSKLQRVVAYILRFKNNCTSLDKLTGPLTVVELRKALTYLCRLCQHQEFISEIDLLSKQKPLPSSSKLSSLNPFLDDDQLLRVGGRIEHSNVSYAQKHPIILPQNHVFTELLIRHEHLTHLHAGPQLLLSIIRLRFWPLKGKMSIKRVLRKCIRCFRAKPVPLTQLMGNLPSDRFSLTRAFFKCSVDYAGPFVIKSSYLRNAKLLKSYLCIFVCLTTKAVHLELVQDLTTQSFINTLIRFISRRGKPSAIYSDNGTNFVGCNNELVRLYDFLKQQNTNTEIHHFLAHDNIAWHFIPANSPHMGGLWEAAVKSAKYHLTRVIHNDHLTFEEMYTVLVQVEACLNSRPLTPLSSDPSDYTALTPSHFLIGESLSSLPEESLIDVPESRLNKFRRLQQIRQHFWTRWSKEYLSQLQTRSKWQITESRKLKEGDLVILKEDNAPPLTWCMGRIVQLFPGKDNIIRVVSVKAPSGAILKRSIAKICLLPTEEDNVH